MDTSNINLAHLLPLLIPIALLEFGLLIWALLDLIRRKSVKGIKSFGYSLSSSSTSSAPSCISYSGAAMIPQMRRSSGRTPNPEQEENFASHQM